MAIQNAINNKTSTLTVGTAAYPTAATQGDIVYASADSTISMLAKDATATRYLANTGASNAPKWDQINLSNGVTGTLPVANGGTGAATYTANAVLIGAGTSAISSVGPGVAGEGLMGSAGAPSWTGSPSYSGTVTGGTGITATTGNVACTAGNITLPTTSATAGQILINSVRFAHAYGTNNTFVGSLSGNFTLSGSGNSALGSSTLDALTSGSNNTGAGIRSLSNCRDGAGNCCLGQNTGYLITSGSYNSALGFQCFAGITTGSYNCGLGNGSGTACVTGSESSNIYVSNVGVDNESNTMRLGTQGTGNGQQNKCYIAGVYDVTVGATHEIMVVDSSHQVGTLKQAAFLVYLSATTGGVTGNGTDYKVLFNTEVYDIGSDYDNATNYRFVAPVTGKYLLGAYVMLGTITNADAGGISIVATSGEYVGITNSPSVVMDSLDATSYHVEVVLDMTAADTAYVQITSSGEGADNNTVVGGTPPRVTYFYGRQLH